jgi:AraC-like DNA-binding protein
LKIKIHKPQNKILQQYIECFYTLQRNDADEDVSYFGFPSNNVFVTLCQDAEITIHENDITIENRKNGKIKSILIIDNQKQGATTYKGKTNEITLYFKPLGINAFLNKPLSHYNTNTITEFNPYEDYTQAINEVFNIDDDAAKIDFLENYFITKFNHFKHPFLKNVIDDILNSNKPSVSVSHLSESNKISRITIHKQFILHIGTSPSQFIKIVRFRNALKMFTKKSTQEQLIDIAYLVEYFDQSHMAKDFKSLTGYSPKAFFSKLSQLEKNQINWIFF